MAQEKTYLLSVTTENKIDEDQFMDLVEAWQGANPTAAMSFNLKARSYDVLLQESDAATVIAKAATLAQNNDMPIEALFIRQMSQVYV